MKVSSSARYMEVTGLNSGVLRRRLRLEGCLEVGIVCDVCSEKNFGYACLFALCSKTHTQMSNHFYNKSLAKLWESGAVTDCALFAEAEHYILYNMRRCVLPVTGQKKEHFTLRAHLLLCKITQWGRAES